MVDLPRWSGTTWISSDQFVRDIVKVCPTIISAAVWIVLATFHYYTYTLFEYFFLMIIGMSYKLLLNIVKKNLRTLHMYIYIFKGQINNSWPLL